MTSLDDARAARRLPHKTSSSGTRSPAQRDRDRILYSSAFRRLSGITQVASPSEFYPVHNRLIHSLKVAQVGRSLAMQLLKTADHRGLIDELGGLDPDVVEAAALAHDLGHPPFGHIAERELHQLLIDDRDWPGVPDGYDGNAQSFRIVTNLASRVPLMAGLNLSRATLNAILKYPWYRSRDGAVQPKWGVFSSEADDFTWCREHMPMAPHERSLEAQLMDWADDIAYAVHDVEDFFRAGLIPLDQFATNPRERELFFEGVFRLMETPADEQIRLRAAFNNSLIVQIGPPGPFRGSQIDRASLRSLTSNLIGRYVRDSISLGRDESGRARLEIDPGIEAEVRILKALTRHYVIESPALMSQRFGQRTLIRSLFELFRRAADRNDVSIFPLFYRDILEQNENGRAGIKRTVADLISGMSEAQAIAVHQRLSGQSLGSALDMYLQ